MIFENPLFALTVSQAFSGTSSFAYNQFRIFGGISGRIKSDVGSFKEELRYFKNFVSGNDVRGEAVK